MNRVEIVLSASGQQPFPVEAVVFEEDTFLVMSAANRITSLPETTDESLYELQEFMPREAGELVVRGNRLYAIVHDFDVDPSFNDAGAREALSRLAELATDRGFECIAIQAFRHSAKDADHEWMKDAIQQALAGTSIKRVWLFAS